MKPLLAHPCPAPSARSLSRLLPRQGPPPIKSVCSFVLLTNVTSSPAYRVRKTGCYWPLPVTLRVDPYCVMEQFALSFEPEPERKPASVPPPALKVPERNIYTLRELS